jgi:hypothetical protein
MRKPYGWMNLKKINLKYITRLSGDPNDLNFMDFPSSKV